MQSQEKDLEARGAPLELAQASRADVSTGPCRIHEWTEGPARNKRREAGGVVCTGPLAPLNVARRTGVVRAPYEFLKQSERARPPSAMKLPVEIDAVPP